MALVATRVSEQTIQDRFDTKKIVRGTLAFDNSYPTNGETLLLSQLGLQSVSQLAIHPSGGYVFVWDGSNNKVKAYGVQDNNSNTIEAMVEVANTTDLSALTAVPFEAIGV